ncbi:hypothetical protein ACO0K2_12920 [Undibacterium sp. MH2W]
MSAMLILVLEALFALSLLIFIVWWTMFSGRKPEQSNSPKRKSKTKKPTHKAD